MDSSGVLQLMADKQLTVAELIKALQDMEPETLVEISFYSSGRTHYERVSRTETILDYQPREQRLVIMAEYN